VKGEEDERGWGRGVKRPIATELKIPKYRYRKMHSLTQVTQIGPDCSEYKVGDRVMGCARFGAYTTHITVNTQYIRPLPANWTFAQGLALRISTPVTA
jgi:hypothetical protein